MTTIVETLYKPDGVTLVPDASIDLQLAGTDGEPIEGFVANASIVDRFQLRTLTGSYTATLTPNSDITPAGTVWRRWLVIPGLPHVIDYITVPATGGPYQVADILTMPPGDLVPAGAVATALLGAPNGVATLDADGLLSLEQRPPGLGGASAYRHIQSSPAAVWTVTHNLGYRPGGIYVVDSSGNEVEGSVAHIDANTLTISFFVRGVAAAMGGEADIS